MIIHASIRLVLAYATIVYFTESYLAVAENASLYEREIDAMPSDLCMLSENGTLVEVTKDVEPDRNTSSRRFFTRPNTFHLFTRRNPTQSQILRIGNDRNLIRSYFNPSRPTRFVTHGWISSRNGSACTLIRNAYLAHDDCNVIVFDWSEITSKPYIWASNRLLSASLEVAKMIDFLADYGWLNPDETTLVGHSLGAHVMGLAGYHSKYMIRNVVGLDPALPMFQFGGPGSSISKMDAKHVQIIHTNGGCLGYLRAVGHTDFYPNGGAKQPGCFLGDILACSCSHQRAYYIFAESITTPKPFYGYRCRSYASYLIGNCSTRIVVPMGGANLKFTRPGKYYLSTGSDPPFSYLN